MSIIVVDSGHGRETGATYHSYVEKKFNLEIALALGKELKLQAPSYQILYTRTNDTLVPLDKRTSFANTNNADLFVSIHCNSCTRNNSASGAEVLYYTAGGKGNQVASEIIKAIKPIFPIHGTGLVERKDLAVLRDTDMPAILIEMFFINNDKDIGLFQNKRSEIVKRIATTIKDTENIWKG